MRYRAIASIAAVALLVLCVGASLLAMGPPERLERLHQHEEFPQLADLPAAERQAASSLDVDAAAFATHLPVVSIDTGGQVIPGEQIRDESGMVVRDEAGVAVVTTAADGAETIPVAFALREPDGQGASAVRLSDEPTVDARAELRLRGHSSRSFSKKSYQVKLTQADRVTDDERDLLSMGAGSSWTLNGPFLDKTLLRNYVALNLFGEVLPYTPEARLIELFVDGSYQGVYLLTETVRRGNDRVPLRRADRNSDATSFIVKRDWLSRDAGTAFDFLTEIQETASPLAIVYPSEELLDDGKRAWIERQFNEFEKALYSYDYDTAAYGYWNTLDVDSFVDYFIVNELALNSDAGLYSTYFYQDLGGRLAIGPIWDFNNAFNNYMERDLSENGFLLVDRPLYFMLVKDEVFVESVITRYHELRADILSNERMLAYIDEAAAYLGPARERNFAVWGFSFDAAELSADEKLRPDERNPWDYEEALAQLKESLVERAEWLDRNIEHLRQFSHESAVKKFNH